MLLAVHQLAVGLPQGSLQLVDAGLVLQQEVLRLIQKLEEHVQKEKNKAERQEEIHQQGIKILLSIAVLITAHLICLTEWDES